MANDMLTMVVQALSDQTAKANDLSDRISAATTDRSKAIHDTLTADNPTDEKIKAFQEFIEKANAEIERQTKAAEAYVESLIPGADEATVDALKTEYRALVDSVKAARKFALTIPGATEDSLKDVPALKNLRGSTAGKGGTGGKRPRLVATEYRTSTSEPWVAASATREDKEGNTVTVTSFTVLAAALSKAYNAKVEVKDLQTAAFEAAGTDDLNTLEGKPFEFATSVGDKTVFVKVAPKHSDAE